MRFQTFKDAEEYLTSLGYRWKDNGRLLWTAGRARALVRQVSIYGQDVTVEFWVDPGSGE